MWLIYIRFIHFQNNHFKETINYNNVLDHILQKNTGRNQINSIFFFIIIFFHVYQKLFTIKCYQ